MTDAAASTLPPREERLRATGLRALVDSAVTSHERLPMLDVVYDRLLRSLTASMRAETSDHIDIRLQSVTAVRFSTLMSEVPTPSMLGVVKIPQWENYALYIVDQSLTYATLDALLGGRRYDGVNGQERDSFTAIEISLMKSILDTVSKDLSSAFAPIAEAEFLIDRIETKTAFVTFLQPSNICSVATIKMSLGNRQGSFQIVLPYVTIEPIREKLLQRFIGERLGHDDIWERHLEHEIRQTDVPVSVVFGEKQMRLQDVLNFEIGQVVVFPTKHDDNVPLLAGGVPIANGHIGRDGQQMALRITSTEPQKDGK